MKKDKFFFFGFGQTAKYFVTNLEKSKKKFTFSATNTKKTTLKNFGKKKFISFKFKDKFYDKKLIKTLSKAEYVLISIPPQKKKDLVLKSFGKFFAAAITEHNAVIDNITARARCSGYHSLMQIRYSH